MLRLVFFASLSAAAVAEPVLLAKRGWDCSDQAVGYGPVISPDTQAAFLASGDISSAASTASTPAGYSNTFKNVKASTSGAGPYLGAASLESYDTAKCASLCDAQEGCAGFNIFYERAPSKVPADACPNPPSTIMIRCVYWGYPVTAATATQTGQWRNDFQVLIAGSNGYNREYAAPVPGYSSTYLGNKSINAPQNCKSQDTYIMHKIFSDSAPFCAARCAAACEEETQYNIDFLNARSICRFFVTYIGFKNGVPQGQYCALYTQAWTPEYATNEGYFDGADQYTIGQSAAYANTSDLLIAGPDCSSSSSTSCTHSSTSSSEISSSTEIYSTTTWSSSSSSSSSEPSPTSSSSTSSSSISITSSSSSSSSSTFSTITTSSASSSSSSLTPSGPINGCSSQQTINLCCMNIAPFSSNSAVWGGICGYNPPSPDTLVGARCISRPANGVCPGSTSAACCKGTWPGQCGLGTECARPVLG